MLFIRDDLILLSVFLRIFWWFCFWLFFVFLFFWFFFATLILLDKQEKLSFLF